jgi:hypothetical protein
MLSTLPTVRPQGGHPGMWQRESLGLCICPWGCELKNTQSFFSRGKEKHQRKETQRDPKMGGTHQVELD